MSRSLTRTLGSLQQVEIKYKLDSYAEAMDYVKRDKVNGFFVIPEGFAEKALSGRKPELSYYINFGYIVPGSLLIKGYTTISMLTIGALIEGILDTRGASVEEINSALQPFVNDVYMLGNPRMNYGVYLVNSFAPGVLALMVMLVTCYVITIEIKNATTREWLKIGGGSILVAVSGKLLPFTVLFTLVGWLMQVIFYVVAQYPMNGDMWTMLLAMFLLVVACQSFAVAVCSLVPNPRYALSVCSLVAMLAFSLGGYSFPVEDMYPGVAIFSYILPMRYYFLIYIDQALNGLGFVFSRYYYAALLVFPLVALLFLPKLKKAMAKPVVYVP
jgi:ABC-2 type transport system permease protein